MHQGILLIVIYIAKISHACPYLASHSRSMLASKEQTDKLINMENNAFYSPGLTADLGGYNLMDAVMYFQESGVWPADETMCYFSFQGLPPPDSDWTQNEPDFARFVENAHNATRLLQAYGPPVAFAGTTSGAYGAPVLCDAGYDVDTQCQDGLAESPIAWPEAIVILEFNSNLNDTIISWRTLPDAEGGHLSNMNWVWYGGQPENGGSVNAGWGQGAPGTQTGLKVKIVPCSDIDDEFFYPTQDYGVDTIWEGDSEPLMTRVYQHWDELCGYNIVEEPYARDCSQWSESNDYSTAGLYGPGPSFSFLVLMLFFQA